MTPTFVVDISRTVASALRDPAVIAAIHEALGQLAAENRKPKTRKERLPWNIQEAIEKAGPRRIRLFACALVRELGDAVPPVLRPLIDVAEAFADGLVGEQELTRAREDAWDHLPGRRWSTPEQTLLSGRWLPEECVWTLLREDAYTIALHGLRRVLGARKVSTDLLRHHAAAGFGITAAGRLHPVGGGHVRGRAVRVRAARRTA